MKKDNTYNDKFLDELADKLLDKYKLNTND